MQNPAFEITFNTYDNIHLLRQGDSTMRNIALTNLFLLAVAFLASFCTANIANAAPDSQTLTIYNKDNQYSAFVCIVYEERQGNRVCDVVQGWYEIKPGYSHKFNKGNNLSQFYIYIEVKKTPQRLPFDRNAYYIHPDRFRTESQWRDCGVSNVYIVDDDAIPEYKHIWGLEYQNRAIKPSSNFLKNNGWKSAIFYEIPRECQTLTLNQHR